MRRRVKAGKTAAHDAAVLFAALGDETRLALVTRLCADGVLSITALTAGLNITRQAVTKHLRALSEVGLVRGRRSGRETLWQMDRRSIKDARRCLALISEQWDDALERLREHVEEK